MPSENNPTDFLNENFPPILAPPNISPPDNKPKILTLKANINPGLQYGHHADSVPDVAADRLWRTSTRRLW